MLPYLPASSRGAFHTGHWPFLSTLRSSLIVLAREFFLSLRVRLVPRILRLRLVSAGVQRIDGFTKFDYELSDQESA